MLYYILLVGVGFMLANLLITLYLMSDFSFKVEMWIQDACKWITRRKS